MKLADMFPPLDSGAFEGLDAADAAVVVVTVQQEVRRLARPFSDAPNVSEDTANLARSLLEVVAVSVPLVATTSVTAEIEWEDPQEMARIPLVGDSAASAGGEPAPGEGRIAEMGRRWDERRLAKSDARARRGGRRGPTAGTVWLSIFGVVALIATGVFAYGLQLVVALLCLVLALLFFSAALNARRPPRVRPPEEKPKQHRTPVAVARARVDLDAVARHVRTALAEVDRELARCAGRGSQAVRPGATGGDRLDDERVLDILQAVAAGAVEDAATKPKQWAVQAATLLGSIGLDVVAFDGANSHLFDDRPSGVAVTRMRLPALVTHDGATRRRGVLLVPTSH